MSQVSLSNAHHLSECKDLDSTRFFRRLDFVHCNLHCTHCLHHQSYKGVLVQWVERLKRFQAHFRCSSSSSSQSTGLCFLAFGVSFGCFSATVFFPFCWCGSCLREPSCSCGDLGRLLTRFCGSTAGELSSTFSKMNVEVFALAISICRLFWNDLFVQLIVVVQLMMMRDSYPRVLHLIPHRLLE